MKTENKIIFFLTIVLIIVSLFLFIKKYNEYKNITIITSNPFKEIKILNQNIEINNKERSYTKTIDCSSLIDKNTEIISYNLKENYQDYKISISTKLYNENYVIIDDFNNISNMEINMFITDPQDTYEQLYYIKAICE